MTAAEAKKQRKVEALSTEVLQRICNSPQPPESLERSEAYPLGGLVHITGIGQVTLLALNTELAKRVEGV